ncbi:MAG: hypothetical protein ACLU4N_18735 [Butyricimonas faecihominis]
MADRGGQPNDPIDHQRYLIFQETGIPFITTTPSGARSVTLCYRDPYTYYEVLQVFYSGN